MDLEGSLGSSVNKVSPSSPALPSDKLKVYQSTAARLNYLALDRPDIGFGVKELMRRMARPTEQDLQALKRVVRYLLSLSPGWLLHIHGALFPRRS